MSVAVDVDPSNGNRLTTRNCCFCPGFVVPVGIRNSPGFRPGIVRGTAAAVGATGGVILPPSVFSVSLDAMFGILCNLTLFWVNGGVETRFSSIESRLIRLVGGGIDDDDDVAVAFDC